MKLSWYVHRLRCMLAAEMAMRAGDALRKARWRRFQVQDTASAPMPAGGQAIAFATAFGGMPCVPMKDLATRRLVAAAEGILAGRWPVFGQDRTDLSPVPDWFRDGATDLTDRRNAYCFDLDWRDESNGLDLKRVWELSRHHHLTVLAAAFALTRDPRYAERIAAHLQSWWRANPFLSGIHWTMGIEVGMRLIAWVWIRRLLQGWSGVAGLFERNPTFVKQLYWHQSYLAHFHSHGSSANNHLLAEAAGLFASSCAFRGFPETDAWRLQAAAIIEREAPRQAFPDGINRELATDYHGFVLELLLTALVEGVASGNPLDHAVWRQAQNMTDALAAILDVRGRPPRQGDSDDGTALLLDAPAYDRWGSLLAIGARLFTACDWWPQPRCADLRTRFWSALVPAARNEPPRSAKRPSLFADAGMTILRDHGAADAEIWCRCDHGPHGHAPLFAHAHADALSVELRFGGVEILADPGTYCYQSNRAWRDHFRSTRAHNCLELAGQDQSVAGGAFLWLQAARAELLSVSGLDEGPVAEWTARHDGYRRLHPPAEHERTVRLDRINRSVTITDRVRTSGRHRCRLAFHFGPAVEVDLKGTIAHLRWVLDGRLRAAIMVLPMTLIWNLSKGARTPPIGWYSSSFAQKQPAFALEGEGWVEGDTQFVMDLDFDRFTRRAAAVRSAAASGPAVASRFQQ